MGASGSNAELFAGNLAQQRQFHKLELSGGETGEAADIAQERGAAKQDVLIGPGAAAVLVNRAAEISQHAEVHAGNVDQTSAWPFVGVENRVDVERAAVESGQLPLAERAV